jgi:hypothetical protein
MFDIFGKWNATLPPQQYYDDRWNPETAKNLLMSFGLGAGATGLYHAFHGLTSKTPKKKHDKFYPGPQQPKEEKKAQSPASPSVWSDPTLYGNFLNAGLLNNAGSVLAAAGGAHLMNKAVKQNKKQKYEAQIEEARKMYEESLHGQKVAALHKFFADYSALPAEKRAIWEALGKAYDSTIRTDYSPITMFNRAYGQYAGTAAGLAGALGAGLAYDFGKQRTQGAAIQRAQEARARMSALPPMWVEPDAAVLMKRRQQRAQEDNDSEASSKAASA